MTEDQGFTINWNEMDTEPGPVELEVQQQYSDLVQQAEEAQEINWNENQETK